MLSDQEAVAPALEIVETPPSTSGRRVALFAFTSYARGTMTGDTPKVWYYLHPTTGQPKGPFSEEDFTVQLRTYQDPRDILIQREGLLQWVPASMVEPFREALPLSRTESAELIGATGPPPAEKPRRERRGYLTDCPNCDRFAITLSHRDSAGRAYCSEYCRDWAVEPTHFCERCLANTTDEPIDGLTTVNGIGVSLVGKGDKCPECRSVVRRTWFTFLFVPLIPLWRYRVIHTSPHSFFARRLRKGAPLQ